VTRPWTCYLIHFTERYEHAGHYTGSTPDLPARLAKHESGQGARLMAVIKDAGISWVLARTWPGGRDRERQLKQQGGASRHCPVCKGGPGIDWKAGPALIPTPPGPRSPKLSVTPPEEPLWDSVSARLTPAEARELGRRLADAERGAWAAAGESTSAGWRARMDLACDMSRLRNTEASAVQRLTEAREIAQTEGWAPEPGITGPGPADAAPCNSRQQEGPAPMGSFTDERESTDSARDAGAQEGREVTRARTGKLDPEQLTGWARDAIEGLHGAATSDADRAFAEGFERESLRVSADYQKAGRELAACYREPGSPHPDPDLATRGWHVSECGVYSRARGRAADAEAAALAEAPDLEREAG
jgi:predicted GIY-YIG superfamily endonuclease